MQTTKIHPTQNRILLQDHEGGPKAIKLLSDTTDPDGWFEVLAVGELVKGITPGNRVLLQPNANITGLKSSYFGMEGKIAIVYDTVVIAVVDLDAKATPKIETPSDLPRNIIAGNS